MPLYHASLAELPWICNPIMPACGNDSSGSV